MPISDLVERLQFGSFVIDEWNRQFCQARMTSCNTSVNVDSLPIPAWEKPIARTMQNYGMYLRDQGGSFVIYAENPVARGYDAWSKAGLPSGDSVSLTGIPWAKLRVITPPC